MPTFDEIRRIEKKKVVKSLKGSREPAKVNAILSTFYETLDNSIEGLVSAYNIPVECKDSCSYCCLLKVDAKAHEIFSIVDFIENSFSKADIHELKVRLKESADLISPLTAEEHLVSNIKCGLLINDSCSVYPVRPSLCRKFHSTSVDLCKASYERPTDPSVPKAENETLELAVVSAIYGFDEGLKKSKLDASAYEINKALLYALESDEYKSKWRRGNKAFPSDAKAKE